MTEATKANPAPLDAYETAKAEEPIFVLQGGDPIAAPLVRLWAYLARVRTGLRGDVAWIETPIQAAKYSSIEHDPDACKNLLARATAAEQVSWHMDGYRRGEVNITQEMQELDDLQKLDIYDIRRRCASAISNFFSNLNDYREELTARGFIIEGDEINNIFEANILSLRTLAERIEIKRGNL